MGGKIVGCGKDFQTFWIWESRNKITESRNGTFIETVRVDLMTVSPIENANSANDNSDGDDQNLSRGGDSMEESDIDRGSSSHVAAYAARTAREVRQLGDYVTAPESLYT